MYDDHIHICGTAAVADISSTTTQVIEKCMHFYRRSGNQSSRIYGRRSHCNDYDDVQEYIY